MHVAWRECRPRVGNDRRIVRIDAQIRPYIRDQPDPVDDRIEVHAHRRESDAGMKGPAPHQRGGAGDRADRVQPGLTAGDHADSVEDAGRGTVVDPFQVLRRGASP